MPWPAPSYAGHDVAVASAPSFRPEVEASGWTTSVLVVPISADQPYSAERVAALGVGRAVGPGDRTADAIRDALVQVLDDPSCRANAEAFQGEMTALPGPDEMVELLESGARQART